MAALPSIGDHSLFFIDDLVFEKKQQFPPPILQKRLGDLARHEVDIGKWILPDIRPALLDRYARNYMWQEASGPVSDDLLPSVQSLLSGNRRDLLRIFQLTPEAIRLIQRMDLYTETKTREERARHQLVFVPGKRAKQRIARESDSHETFDFLPINIKSIIIYLFRSGVGLTVFEIEIAKKNCSTVELIETEVGLSRFGNISWFNSKNGTLTSSRFALSDITNDLIRSRDFDPNRSPRSFTYSFVSFASEPSEGDARDFAQHLARHYTSDYAVLPEAGRMRQVRDFSTVRHLATLEGATTIVDPTPTNALGPVDFLRNFKQTAVRRAYLPIVLLALHERAFLSRATSSLTFWPEVQSPSDACVERLEDARERVLAFRLGFRFSEISRLSLHNDFNLALRDSLGLDRMADELSTDVRDVSEFLRQVGHHRLEQRFQLPSVIGAGGLAALTTFTLVKEFLSSATPLDKGLVGAIAVGIGIAFGVAASWMSWRKSHGSSLKNNGHEGHSLAHHATHENVIKQALNEH